MDNLRHRKMLRKPASSNTLEVETPTNPSSYESKTTKSNTSAFRKLIYVAGVILSLTIFTMAVSIVDDGFHLVSCEFQQGVRLNFVSNSHFYF